MGGIWTISIVLLLQYSLFIDESFAQNVEAAFRQFGLSPLVVPVPPEERLDAVYPSGARVDLGNRLTPTQTSQMPVISLPPDAVSDDRLYTLAVFDVDYVSGDVPILSGAVQWLVGNIPGQRVEAGETIARYEGPIPLVATGPHRIVFLYYQQPARIDFQELSLLDGYIFVRFLFQAPAFAAKYNLGDPIAGNFFITQFDLGWFSVSLTSITSTLDQLFYTAQYASPVPLPATGDHRIVFLYYEQRARLKFDEFLLVAAAVRPIAFDVRRFEAKYNLGNPIARNLFVTQSDVVGVKNALNGLVIS